MFLTLLPWLLLSLMVGWVVRRFLLPPLPKVDAKAERGWVAGQVIWITGASSGIGKALAKHLRSHPTVKLVLSARNESALADLKQQLVSAGVKDVLVLPLDLEALAQQGGSELASAAARTVESKFGRVDVLIHNGGISQRGDVFSTVQEVERRLMDTNFGGAVALTHAVLPGMIQRKSGHILAMSSVQGLLPLAFRSSYGASKHALNAYFHSLRYEVADFNVHVSVMCPGYVSTNLSRNALSADGATYGKMDATIAKGYPPSYIAALAYATLRERVPEVVVADMTAKAAIMLQALAPALLTKLILARTRKERLKPPKEE